MDLNTSFVHLDNIDGLLSCAGGDLSVVASVVGLVFVLVSVLVSVLVASVVDDKESSGEQRPT